MEEGRRISFYDKRMFFYWEKSIKISKIFFQNALKIEGLHKQNNDLCFPNNEICFFFFPLVWWFSCKVMSNSATPWTVAHQAPLFTGFSGQEYWSGMLFLSPGDLSNPGIEPESPTLQADILPTEIQGKLIFSMATFKRQSWETAQPWWVMMNEN